MKTPGNSLRMLLGTLALALPLLALPQKKEHDHKISEEEKEKIESFRVAYLSTRLNLTPEKAEEFWPVYYEYRNKKESLEKELWRRYRALKQNPEMTESQASELLNASLVEMQAQYILKRDFIAKLRTMFSDTWIIRLQQAEMDFKKELLKRLDEFKSDNQSEK